MKITQGKEIRKENKVVFTMPWMGGNSSIHCEYGSHKGKTHQSLHEQKNLAHQ